MKKKTVLLPLCFILTLCVLLTGSAEAAGGAPGSAADPLITQSYVDERFDRLYDMILALSGSQITMPENGGGVSTQDINYIIDEVLYRVEGQNSSLPAYGTYVPVFASRGQVILGGEGTEIILRSGQATAYVFGENGITDATDGQDLLNGDDVWANHLLIVPRNDGRGVYSVTDAWYLVKGTYTIIY